MPNRTNISWTDFTSSPIRYRDRDGKSVWACVRVSPGCQHCYSAELAKRYNRGKDFVVKNMQAVTPYVDEAEMHKLATSKIISGHKIFMMDMTDLFGDWIPKEMIDQVFAMMALRPDVTFQVLTKRADRMLDYVDDQFGELAPKERKVMQTAFAQIDLNGGRLKYEGVWQFGVKGRIFEAVVHSPQGRLWRKQHPNDDICGPDGLLPSWPLPNVWLGTSTEDQQRADERIPLLLRTPAAVRFISAEPLLGPINLRPFVGPKMQPLRSLGWVITGGESGPHYRHADPQWFRDIRDQCQAAGVALWHKQGSSAFPGQNVELDGEVLHSFPKVKTWK
jgi:protein gp37